MRQNQGSKPLITGQDQLCVGHIAKPASHAHHRGPRRKLQESPLPRIDCKPSSKNATKSTCLLYCVKQFCFLTYFMVSIVFSGEEKYGKLGQGEGGRGKWPLTSRVHVSSEMDSVCEHWLGIGGRAIVQRVNHRIHTKREIRAKRVRCESSQMWETVSLPRLGIFHFHLSFSQDFSFKKRLKTAVISERSTFFMLR